MPQNSNIDYFLFGSLFTLFFLSCIIAPASTILYSYGIIFFGNYVTFWQVVFSWLILCIISLVLIWDVRELELDFFNFVKSLVLKESNSL